MNSFEQYFAYFAIGIIIGAGAAAIIFSLFFRLKLHRLSSQIHGQTDAQRPEQTGLADLSARKTELAENVIDIHSDKTLLLHEKEIDSFAKFASSLSHDLNNLVGSIMGYTALLKKKLRPNTKEFYYAETIEKSSKQIIELVKRVLGFSHLDTKTIEVVDLNQFVKTISEEFSSVHSERHKVNVSVASKPVRVQISTGQLKQVLWAILKNAADSMEAGGTIKCSIYTCEEPGATKDLDKKQRQCLVEIEDHGTGMSEEVKQRIFEPFFTTKDDRKYAGLSLSQVFNIVKQHNGSISVDSSLGNGTKVKIRFPLHTKEEVTGSKGAILQDLQSKGSKILVVDDEENVRQLGFDILTENGFQVITANDGLDALQKLKENPDVRLVVLDMIMPVMTGKDACVEIKKMEHPPKVLICTGFSGNSDLKAILGTYAEGLVQKPYRTGELIAAVRNLLRDTA